MIPELRRDGEMIIGRSTAWTKRWVRPRLGQIRDRLRCWAFGHCWSNWQIDDYDGPGEYIDGDPDSFMPFTSRESRADEFGIRVCERRCGSSEMRYSIAETPVLWIEKLMDQERASALLRQRDRSGRLS